MSAVGDFGYLGRTLDAGHTYPARTEEWEVDLELRTVATSRQGVPACALHERGLTTVVYTVVWRNSVV
jgi:hypothetical protein